MNGVLIVACGSPVYGNYAFNLALSLQKQVPICVAYSGLSLSELSEDQLKWFDEIIEVPEEYYSIRGVNAYQRVKVCADLITPFKKTLLLDADTVWNDCPVDFDIEQIGTMGVWTPEKDSGSGAYTYWSDPKKMSEYFGVPKIYMTYSGYICFSDEKFDLARFAYDDEGLDVIKWGGDKPDEYAFNVHYGAMNIRDKFSPIAFQHGGAMYSEYMMRNKYKGFTFAGSKPDRYILTVMRRRLQELSSHYKIPYQTNLDKTQIKERIEW